MSGGLDFLTNQLLVSASPGIPASPRKSAGGRRGGDPSTSRLHLVGRRTSTATFPPEAASFRVNLPRPKLPPAPRQSSRRRRMSGASKAAPQARRAGGEGPAKRADQERVQNFGAQAVRATQPGSQSEVFFLSVSRCHDSLIPWYQDIKVSRCRATLCVTLFQLNTGGCL